MQGLNLKDHNFIGNKTYLTQINKYIYIYIYNFQQKQFYKINKLKTQLPWNMKKENESSVSTAICKASSLRGKRKYVPFG
jgi:hypothetical protein